MKEEERVKRVLPAIEGALIRFLVLLGKRGLALFWGFRLTATSR